MNSFDIIGFIGSRVTRVYVSLLGKLYTRSLSRVSNDKRGRNKKSNQGNAQLVGGSPDEYTRTNIFSSRFENTDTTHRGIL